MGAEVANDLHDGLDPNAKPTGVATIKTLHTEDYELPDADDLIKQFEKEDRMYPHDTETPEFETGNDGVKAFKKERAFDGPDFSYP